MRWHGTFAPGSFAQLVALQLLELLHPCPPHAPETIQQPRVCKILEGGATAPRTRWGVHFLQLKFYKNLAPPEETPSIFEKLMFIHARKPLEPPGNP